MFRDMVGRGSGALVLAGILFGALVVIGAPSGAASGVGAGAVLAGPSIHHTIALGKESSGAAYDSTNFDIYVANEGSNDVTVINSVTYAHSTISVGKSPTSVTFDPYNGKIYATNTNSSNLTIISGATNKVVTNPSTGKLSHPLFAIFDPASGGVIVLNSSGTTGGNVGWFVANSTNAVTKLSFGTGPYVSAAYSPASKEVYVTNFLSKSLSAVSSTGSIKKIALAGEPTAVAYDPGTKSLLVELEASTFLKGPRVEFLSSTDAVVKTITVSAVNEFTSGLPGYDPHTGSVYLIGYNVTLNRTDAVVISSAPALSATTFLAVGPGYALATYDPANGNMYVTGDSKSVVVLNLTSVVKRVTTSQPVIDMIYDPALKDMVGAGDVNRTTVSVLYFVSSTNGLTSITVGKLSLAVFYDPKDTYVFVVSLGSDAAEFVG